MVDYDNMFEALNDDAKIWGYKNGTSTEKSEILGSYDPSERDNSSRSYGTDALHSSGKVSRFWRSIPIAASLALATVGAISQAADFVSDHLTNSARKAPSALVERVTTPDTNTVVCATNPVDIAKGYTAAPAPEEAKTNAVTKCEAVVNAFDNLANVRADRNLGTSTNGFEYAGKTWYGERRWSDETAQGIPEERTLSIGDVRARQVINSNSVEIVDYFMNEVGKDCNSAAKYGSPEKIRAELAKMQPESQTIFEHRDKGKVAAFFGAEYFLGNETTRDFFAKGTSGLERYIKTETGEFIQSDQTPGTHLLAGAATLVSTPTYALDNLMDGWDESAKWGWSPLTLANKVPAKTANIVTSVVDGGVKGASFMFYDASQGVGAVSRGAESGLQWLDDSLDTSNKVVNVIASPVEGVVKIGKVPFQVISSVFGSDDVEHTDDLAMNGTEHKIIQGIGGGLKIAATARSFQGNGGGSGGNGGNNGGDGSADIDIGSVFGGSSEGGSVTDMYIDDVFGGMQ